MSNFNNLVNVEIPKLLEDLGVENDIFKMQFKAGRYHEQENKIVDKALCTCISVDVDLTNKLTSSFISFRKDILYLPVMTEMGFKIGNSYKQVLSLYDRAKGWYLRKGKEVPSDKVTADKEYIDGNIPVDASTMSFMPVSGRHLQFSYKDGKIMVSTKTKAQCSIGHFLKALTGRTYQELIGLLGTNMYIMTSLTDEVSFKEAVKNVAPLFLTSREGRDINNQAKTLQRMMFSPEYMVVNEASRIRLATATSFTKRAIGCELIESVTIGDTVIQEGTELQRDTCELLDKSGVTELKVKKNGKVFDLRKYSFDNNKVTENELFTMVNMYACLLDGYRNFDEEYELTSRVLISFEQSVKDKIKEKIGIIKREVENKLDLEGAKSDISLFNIAKGIVLNDISDIIRALSDAASKETQMADNSNPISFESKNSKVTTALNGKAPKDMVRIQDTQRGHIDPIESPESNKIGKVHYKTVVCETDENGFSTVPYIRVNNGTVVSEEPVHLTADETRYEYIAEWNEKFEADEINVFYNGTIIKVPKNKVKLMGYSPFDEMGLARSGIPFQNFSNPKRLLMGSNYERQADPIVAPERAIISTGNEIFLPKLVFTARRLLTDYWDDTLVNNPGGLNKEDFIECPVKLTGTTITSGKRKYDFIVKTANGPIRFSKTLPFLQRTEKSSSFSYKLNPSKNNDTYQGDDVIIYHGGIDVRNYDIEWFADYGHYKVKDEKTGKLRPVEPKDLKYGLAIGRNLRVGFTTYESFNIDDAIVIRQGLVYENKLTSIIQKEITAECASGDGFYENFGFPSENEQSEPYMNANGLPKIGTILKPGDLVIAKYRVKTEGQETVFVKNSYLHNNISGEVVNATFDSTGKIATVTLAYLSPIEEGDKIVGRYGNKGVVARIVPDSLMKYDAETGQPLDVCLNPLGVPSRMNISQLLEDALGDAMHKRGKICIATPFKDNTMEYIRSECEKANVKPTKLIDGRTGLPLDRPVNVGIMYMLKLEHMVNKKIHAINITNSVNPITKQPNQGSKRDGGQAFGEMEVWCLQACNAHKVLQDLMSVQSDDVKAQKAFRELVNENPYDINVECTNNNDKYFMVMIRSMGCNVVNKEDNYIITPLTDDNCRTFTPNPCDPENPDSIYNLDYFGTPNREKKRRTVERSAEDCWSYVNLHCEIVHPVWIKKSSLNKMLLVGYEGRNSIKIKPITKDGLNKLIEGKATLVLNDDGVYTYNPSKLDIPGAVTGMEAVVKLIRSTDLDDVEVYYNNEVEKAKESENKDYYGFLETINAINRWKELGIKLTDFIISTLPIMPNSYRPRTKAGMKRKFFANQHYGRIFTAICDVKNAHNNSNVYHVYRTIGEFTGVLQAGGSQQDIQTVEEYYFGKGSDNHGAFRQNLLSKRQHMSGRSIINPNGNLTVDQIGVPILMAVEIWKIHLIAMLKLQSPIQSRGYVLDEKEYGVLLDTIASSNVYKFCKVLRLDVSKDANRELFFETRKFVISFLEEQITLFGRQPSLAKFSCRAYKVVVTFHKTLELNPLVCKGYNADFDGDQMYLVGIMNTEAAEEAWEKMSAKHWVINPKDSSNIMEHGQDMVLGTYYATMLHDNVKDIREDERYNSIYFVSSLTELKDEVEVGNIHIHDLVSIRVDGRMYLSTAGRILFNSLIPGGFTEEPFTNNLKLPVVGQEEPVNENTKAKHIPAINPSRYYNLKMDGLISAKGKSKDGMVYYSLSKYTKQLFTEVDVDTCMKTYQDIMNFGFHYCDISGLTIGIADLDVKIDLQTTIDKANKLAEQINKWYFDGIVSDAGRKSLLINVYNKATKYLKDKVVFKNLPRNNNIAIILDSGSRGNIDQVMQTIGIIGISMKTNSESLETPILHAYGTGLTSFEMFTASYGARMGINSTQNETADAGYCTRQTVYMTNGLRVVEEDCGNEDDEYFIEYTELESIQDDDGNLWDDRHLESPNNGQILTNPSEILLGKELTDSPINEYPRKVLEKFLPVSDKLNDTCVKQLIKHKVDKIECTDTTYYLSYSMDATIKDDMFKRLLTMDVIHPRTGKVIVKSGTYLEEDDINKIESAGVRKINLRTMITCRAVNGICAKCYGKRFDFNKLPKVGEYVGVESAQAIGEPAAQLSMNVSHKGGIAAGATRGVSYYDSLLGGYVPKKDAKAITSNVNQHIEVKLLGDHAQINNNGKIMTVPTDSLLVENGEYVEFGDLITGGNIVLNDMGDARDNLEVIRKRQMTLLKMYHSTFQANNLDVHARHFEVLVRVQMSLVKVLESDDPNIKAGQDAELSEVLKSIENGYNISYDFAIAKQSRVISYYGGILAGLAFERFDEVMTNSAVMQEKNPNVGVLAQIVVGEDVRVNYDEEGNVIPSKRKELVQGFNASLDAQEILEPIDTENNQEEINVEVTNTNIGISMTEADDGTIQYDFGEQSISDENSDITLEDIFGDDGDLTLDSDENDQSSNEGISKSETDIGKEMGIF